MDQYLSDNCYIEEINGFLKYRCLHLVEALDMWNGLWLKCHNTDDYYFLERFNSVGYRGKVCSDDPHFYQACDNTLKGFRVTNDTILKPKHWLLLLTGGKRLPESVL